MSELEQLSIQESIEAPAWTEPQGRSGVLETAAEIIDDQVLASEGQKGSDNLREVGDLIPEAIDGGTVHASSHRPGPVMAVNETGVLRTVDEESFVLEFTPEETGELVEFYRGPPRKEPYKGRFMYILSMMSISLGLGSIWRFPSILIQLNSTDKIGIWNVFLPWAIVLLVGVWPLLVAEGACAQLVMGGAIKTYASIAARLRSTGIAFIGAMAVLLFLPYIGSVSFSHMMSMWGDYSPSALYFDGQVERCRTPINCPSSPSPMYDMRSLNLDSIDSMNGVSWLNTDSLVYGTSSICQLPIARTSNSTLCGFAWLETTLDDQQFQDVLPAIRENHWDDYGNFFNWKSLVGMVVIWICAFSFVLFGNRVMQWVRPIICFFSVGTLVALGVVAATGNDQGKSRSGFKAFLKTLDTKALKSPEIWSATISQSLFALGMCQGVVPSYSVQRERFTENVVADQQINMIWNTLLNITTALVVAAMAMAGQYGMLGDTPEQYGENLRMIAALGPLKETWLTADTMFGNWNPNQGWIFCFYLATFLVCINQVAALLDVLTMTLAGPRSSSKIKLMWCLFFTIIFIGLNVIEAWAVGYPLAISFQHFSIDVFLPLIAYLESTAIGWLVNINKSIVHLGKLASWSQFGLYHVGCWTAAICTALLFESDTWCYRWLGMVIGAVLVLFSIIVPPFLCNATDNDGNKMSFGDKFSFTFWHNVERLRHQINVAFCHNSHFKLTACWSVLIKYVAPFGFAFAFAMPVCQRSQLYWFSAYRPFHYSDRDPREDLGLPIVLVVVGALVPIIGVLVWCLTIIWPKCLYRCTPEDSSSIYYDPLNAHVEMEDLDYLQQQDFVPVEAQ